eukprot:gene5831-39928_t
MTNVVAMRRGAAVVELFPNNFRYYMFEELARMLGLHYGDKRCKKCPIRASEAEWYQLIKGAASAVLLSRLRRLEGATDTEWEGEEVAGAPAPHGSVHVGEQKRYTVYDAFDPPSYPLLDYLQQWCLRTRTGDWEVLCAVIYIDRLCVDTDICWRAETPYEMAHYAYVGGTFHGHPEWKEGSVVGGDEQSERRSRCVPIPCSRNSSTSGCERTLAAETTE